MTSKSYWQNLWNALTMPQAVDADEARREYMTRVISLIVAVVALEVMVIFVLGWMVGFLPLDSVFIILVMTLAFGGAWWLTYRGHWRAAGYIPPTVVFLTAVYGNWIGGAGAPAMVLYALAIVLTAILQSERVLWVMLALSIAAYLGISGALLSGYIVQLRFPETAFANRVVIVVSAYISLAFLLWFLISQFRRALAQARVYAERVAVANQQLEQEIIVRQQAEESLRQSNETLQALIDCSPLAIVKLDADGQVLLWNRAAESLYGWTLAEVLGKFVPVIPEKYLPESRAISTRLLKGEVFTNLEVEHRHKDGSAILVNLSMSPLRDAQGTITAFMSINVDITESHKAKAALRESEEKYKLLIETTNTGYVILDDHGQVMDANQEYIRLTGHFKLEEILGKSVLEWTAKYDRERNAAAVRKCVDQGFVRNLEIDYINLTGEVIPVEINATALRTSGAFRIQSLCRDITERKRAEEEREVLQHLAQAFTASLALKTLVKILAEHCRRLFKYDSFRFDLYDELAGMRTPVYGEDTPLDGQEPVDVETADDAARPQAIQAVLTGEKVLINRKEGRITDDLIPWGFAGRRSRSMMFIPVRWQGHCIGVASVQSYTPERYSPRDLELGQMVVDQCGAALARVQAEAEREKLIAELEAKNAELERFTYTVSHDLKAPLITIRGFLGLLEKDARASEIERMQSDMQRIVEATDKMQRLLSELLELSRIGRLINPPTAVPFEAIVHEALDLVHGQLEARGVRVEIAPHLPLVYGDRARLVEVVQNLVDNAAKFMGDQAEPQIVIGQQGTAQDGKPIFFVRDNGIGIDPAYHANVFGLFDKLDPRSEGTGIGLALVKRIVEVHGGRIWLESTGGNKGAKFFFTLPCPQE
jgi:PAS domain S-box-containing protein